MPANVVILMQHCMQLKFESAKCAPANFYVLNWLDGFSTSCIVDNKHSTKVLPRWQETLPETMAATSMSVPAMEMLASGLELVNVAVTQRACTQSQHTLCFVLTGLCIQCLQDPYDNKLYSWYSQQKYLTDD
jgi:hypothetical protein